jgi:hypothetical protein
LKLFALALGIALSVAVTAEFGIPRRHCIGDDAVERMEESGQLSFLCSRGAKAIELKTLGCCRSCYDRQYRSLRLFGGLRDRVLKRDGFRCRSCGARSRLLVHHRDKHNDEELLLTLCIGCHMRVHHSYGFRHWLPATLLRLWREWHTGEPVQLQLSLESVAENVATPVKKARIAKVSLPSTTESAVP